MDFLRQFPVFEHSYEVRSISSRRNRPTSRNGDSAENESGTNAMKRSNHQRIWLGLLATAICCGCQTSGIPTIRAQSPSGYGETTKIRGPYHTPVRSAAEEFQDIVHEHHDTTTYYYTPGAANQGMPAGYGNCPPGGTSCPPNGTNCPPGCPPGGEVCPPIYGPCNHAPCNAGFGQDKFSYAYRVPNDLVYPPAGGVGGAVVYPYYTHKGPSDFFRQK